MSDEDAEVTALRRVCNAQIKITESVQKVVSTNADRARNAQDRLDRLSAGMLKHHEALEQGDSAIQEPDVFGTNPALDDLNDSDEDEVSDLLDTYRKALSQLGTQIEKQLRRVDIAREALTEFWKKRKQIESEIERLITEVTDLDDSFQEGDNELIDAAYEVEWEGEPPDRTAPSLEVTNVEELEELVNDLAVYRDELDGVLDALED